jgi:hypothetical protein
MVHFYTYKITFVDGFYYLGSRKSKVKPENDVYWGSPKTHKDKWASTMFFKEVLGVYDTHQECTSAEVELIKPVYKTDSYCLNENCAGRVNMTQEVIEKMSKTKKGKSLSAEHKQKLSEAHLGKTHSEETKRKMSETATQMSDETKQKISDSHKGKPKSYDVWNKGKKGVQVPWNKGKKGSQVPWNKGKKVGPYKKID